MRFWSIHPEYLDSKGLAALWREALLAQNVLGNTKGYLNHPQLIRFRQQPDPLRSIGNYLHSVFLEAERRGYKFDHSMSDFNMKCAYFCTLPSPPPRAALNIGSAYDDESV